MSRESLPPKPLPRAPSPRPTPAADEAEPSGERLAKVLARAGVASRREAEKAIEDGRAEVNGVRVYHPGHPVDVTRDELRFDGRPLPKAPPLVYYVMFKPKGTITGRSDPEGRPSVLDLVEHLAERVEPVGRLDMDTEGALLLTNDGDLAHALTHPSKGVPKRYLVKVWKQPSEEKLQRLAKGVQLDDGRTAPCKVRVVSTTEAGNCWVEVTVTEGRNRLVRRMFEAVGHPVAKLRRESFATITIRGMERGDLRALSGEELRRVRDIAEGVPAEQAGHKVRYKEGFARPKPPANKPLSKKRATGKLKPGGGARRKPTPR